MKTNSKTLKIFGSNGFTIVELLVVIIVIGILTAISVLSYSNITQRATVATLQTNLENASKKLAMHLAEFDAYPETLASIGITDSFRYVKDNNVTPKTYSLYASKDNIDYFMTNSSKPAPVTQIVANSTGVVTNVGDYQIHTFNSSGTFSVSSGDDAFELLVVAGGGGGGSSISGGTGGGGAGGLIYYDSFKTPQNDLITITVGAGGAAGAFGLSRQGSIGSDSSIINASSTVYILAKGGGGGGSGGGPGSIGNGANGGSGGGGGYNGYQPTGVKIGGLGVSGQGNSGGSTTYFSNLTDNIPPCVSTSYCGAGGAGGGGAEGVGSINSYPHNSGSGGAGKLLSISGSPVIYAAGGHGGGGTYTPNTAPNTGKGGDASYANSASYSGSSGVVIIRYKHK